MNTYRPRATLRSFLLNADKAQKEFKRAGHRSKDALKHMNRAAKLQKAAAVYVTTSEPTRAEALAVTFHRLYPLYWARNVKGQHGKIASNQLFAYGHH